ncbi:nitroreductase family protein [Capillimicrobium parvum]|uniref:NAD(P)H nitroreductase YdjA n=1 Tax=Capillimicrobium parvum TaxID=2884022 RepID=A0A9E7BX64_9ACTN|nr:nitroreductase [Capillimicrobium parvum]UGS33990.1 Putative NAD(P)H nitroreductase YdjA [Capillimicrobium parvum]
MDLEPAIRTRRTHKVYGPEPVAPETVAELVELARWAPNHHLTNPWRFRLLGRSALERLKAIAEEAKPGSAAKLDRAPTLVAVTVKRSGDAGQDREDLLATGVAAYIVLLAAHARGLAGYWRTVPVLDSPAGRAALGIGDDEEAVGLLYLGRPRQEQRVPERAGVEEIFTELD